MCASGGPCVVSGAAAAAVAPVPNPAATPVAAPAAAALPYTCAACCGVSTPE